MSVYSRLQFNFDFPENNELVLSEAAVKSLDAFPSLLEDWQAKDLGDNNVGGYFENKLSGTVSTIASTSGAIFSILAANPSTNTNAVIGTTTEITNLFTTARSLLANIANTDIASNSECALFLDHTDRISGVIELGGTPEDITERDTTDLPHFKTAIGVGRILTYITHQTDNISNTSVQTGSFTSLFVKNTITEIAITLAPYPTLITNSLTITGSGTEMDPFVRTSNLTLAQVQTLTNAAQSAFTTFKTRREHDVNFYQNSMEVLDEYSEVTYFSKTGETQGKLITEVVGSDKLLSNTRLGVV
jgi:hypothetical protein